MTLPAPLAEDVSNTLLKVLSRDFGVVDHFRELGVWDQAIIETLAIVAKSDKPELPAYVVDEVRGLFGSKAVSPRFQRVAEHHLARIRAY